MNENYQNYMSERMNLLWIGPPKTEEPKIHFFVSSRDVKILQK